MTDDFLPFNCGERISALTGSFNYFAPRWRKMVGAIRVKVAPYSSCGHLSEKRGIVIARAGLVDAP